MDDAGTIILVNRAWGAFARENSVADETSVGVGANYLRICRSATSSCDDLYARQAFHGISSVLAGDVTQFALEYPCHSPVEKRWFLMNVARLGPDGPSGAIISHLDITARKQAELAQNASETRFRAMFQYAAVGIAELGPDGRWLRANSALVRMFGYSDEDLAAKTMQEITHPDDRDADLAHLEVLRSGAADTCVIEKKRFLRKDGAEVWGAASLSCVRASDGSVDYFIVVIEDISSRKIAEERQQTLMHELAHRGKNLLAVVQSLAHRSLSGDRPLAEARTVFSGRLQALAKTYGALTNEAFDGAALDVVLHNELSAFAARAHFEGPSVILTVMAAQTFGLVVHELATNAVKYGALSVPEGQLRVGWEVSATETGQRFVFDWREDGGPPAKTPARLGFGSTLLSRVAAAEFDCEPSLDYGERGFHYRIEAPLGRFGSVLSTSPVRRKLKGEIVCALYDTWARQRGSTGSLPQLAQFDWSKFASTGALTIAKIEDDGQVRFVEVGRMLVGELGRPLTDQDLGGEDGAGMAEVYRQCARKGEPSHEYLRFDFGDGQPLTFERLLVPFSAGGGSIVTHVVGIALYDGNTRPPERGN